MAASDVLYEGNKLTVKRIEEGFLEMCFDAKDASVNVFNEETVRELGAALKVVEWTGAVRGMLITSAKKTFIVGADITEFGSVFPKSEKDIICHFARNSANINRFEGGPFPTVVCINGYALGGGLEFCLACDFRVMSEEAKIGLPETGLGLIPGWGGTVRASRLAGLQTGMEWVVEAKHHDSAEALDAGVVDRVVAQDELREAGIAMLSEALASDEAVRSRRMMKSSAMPLSVEEVDGAVASVKSASISEGDESLSQSSVVDCMAKTALLDRDEALSLELSLFAQLAKSEQAENLINRFLTRK